MNEKQRENLTLLVNQLDEKVSCDGASVKMFVYGGAPDESRMVGNEIGYLRLGIELIKGTLAAQQDIGTDTRSLDIDLDYLETDDSTIYFNDFIIDDKLRKEFVAPNLSQWQKLIFKLFDIGMVIFMLFLFGALITGIATIIYWIIGLLKSA